MSIMNLPTDDVIGKISMDKDMKQQFQFLLNNKESYDNYFTSSPQPGSIIEDIAETDAEIHSLETKLKNKLIENKVVLLHNLLNDDLVIKLELINDEIGRLWELNSEKHIGTKQEQKTEKQHYGEPITDISFVSNESNQKDEFHKALNKLRISNDVKTGYDLSIVLDNLTHINDLLELPTLVETCITTGHYQEALMCHAYSKSFLKKFPGNKFTTNIVTNIQSQMSDRMLPGLINLLNGNISMNSMKKIVNYLFSIEPFSHTNQSPLQYVFLALRLKFIREEVDSYIIDKSITNPVKELLIKRKIECIREHVYGTLSVFNSLFEFNLIDVEIPLFSCKTEKLVPTNIPLLQFVNECVVFLIKELSINKSVLSESICLQLVYCSFRLGDLNINFHHIFMNQLVENNIFTQDELDNAINKRLEFSNKY